MNIPNIKVGFNEIRKNRNGGYIVTATNFDNGFLEKLFFFDGKNTLKEIYSDYNWPGLYEMNGEVYITIMRKIYKYRNNRLELWKEFPGTSYYGTVLGKSEKDFFGAGYEGVLHYNGNDLKILYQAQLNLVGGLIFEKDVFFVGYDSGKKINIIIRGTLQN